MDRIEWAISEDSLLDGSSTSSLIAMCTQAVYSSSLSSTTNGDNNAAASAAHQVMPSYDYNHYTTYNQHHQQTYGSQINPYSLCYAAYQQSTTSSSLSR